MPDPETGKVEDHQDQTGNRLESGPIGRGGGNRILTTAGGLVFTSESGRLVALDAATGKMLWHVHPAAT